MKLHKDSNGQVTLDLENYEFHVPEVNWPVASKFITLSGDWGNQPPIITNGIFRPALNEDIKS